MIKISLSPKDSTQTTVEELYLKMMTPEQVQYIDNMLASIGAYGEVHLIVQKNELRYINVVESRKITDLNHNQ